ncbi:MAG: nuclear transport factor 2 family protein [Bacteroidota bacterium]
MKKLLCILSLVLSFQFLVAQNNKQQDIATIKEARATSNKAIAAHDVSGISKYWLDDFVQIRGNASYLTGKDTIIATWKELFATNAKVSYVRNPTEIIISDNDTLAWETGKWIGINTYSKGGNYSAMWRKKDNLWKIQAELFVALNDK